MSGKGMSFKDARALRDAVASGKVQLIRPDANDMAREMAYISEVRNLWLKRSEYARVIAQQDADKLWTITTCSDPKPRVDPDAVAKLFDLADALAREEMTRNVVESMEVLMYLERPIPEQLAFLAKVLDVPVPESAKETGPRAVLAGPVEGNA
jgi:hypothetical protein